MRLKFSSQTPSDWWDLETVTNETSKPFTAVCKWWCDVVPIEDFKSPIKAAVGVFYQLEVLRCSCDLMLRGERMFCFPSSMFLCSLSDRFWSGGAPWYLCFLSCTAWWLWGGENGDNGACGLLLPPARLFKIISASNPQVACQDKG